MSNAALKRTPREDGSAKFGEYADRGEYHRHLDKTWKYYPVYVEKMRHVRHFLDACPKSQKIVDLGCGEGLLAEEYQKKGYDIVGLDANYESEYVLRGDITKMHFDSGSLDCVLALDVIEHLDFSQQTQAVDEIYRVLRPGGCALLSIPNLAHFASRVSCALTGRLIRTSTIDRHKGDRPIAEYLNLCRSAGLRVVSRRGLFPSLPVLSLLTYCVPGKVVGLHRLYNFVFRVPGFCFLNLVELRKEEEAPVIMPISTAPDVS